MTPSLHQLVEALDTPPAAGTGWPEAEAGGAPPWPEAVPLELIPGLIGDFARQLAPASESDPHAVIFQALAACGALLGRETYVTVEADRHAPAEFVLLIGGTGEGKGTSWGWVRRVLLEASPGFERQIASGVGSGEGMVALVADEQPKKKAPPPPPKDRLVLVYEPEFARPLKVLAREGSTLSAVFRQAFDGVPLAVLTRRDPLRGPAAHVSMVAHVTAPELRRLITAEDVEGGFLNRFVLVATRRARLLPWGGNVDPAVLRGIADRLRAAADWARTPRALRWAPTAAAGWEAIYGALTEPAPGLLGAYRARGRVHVLRMATIFACLDRSELILPPHLEAAVELWRYAEDSARWFFGTATGDQLADHILGLLHAAGPAGLTRAEIRNSPGVSGHRRGADIGGALRLLERHGLAVPAREVTGGRPAERWICAKSAKSPNHKQ